ncbi:FadR/GntR family transcriptional regulator [uncultured Massilia sp.]|uniref:FadR/GntR family transcriptional regulator n=1 Tax=uncultured Massilia sp. TaxID=169973 RepID=UPI00258A4E93|nr:FCD domain-containing protein [uncultured Massilia sp.]
MMETNSIPAAGRLHPHAIHAAAGQPARHDPRRYRQVAERICALAAESGIRPGQRLPSERELAAALAVSRATLRQALTLLELGGIVEVRSCSGVYLRATLQAAQAPGPGPFELLSARRMIEPELAAMAARVATDAKIDALLAAAEAMERVRREEPFDAAACELADRHFHLTLAGATGNGALASVLEHLWSQRGGLWQTLAQLFETELLRDETIADYRRIVQGIAARDPSGARHAMRTHLERYARALSRG